MLLTYIHRLLVVLSGDASTIVQAFAALQLAHDESKFHAGPQTLIRPETLTRA